ncbi:MAG: type IV pilus secretin PilQ [Desulfobacterales bacterium]
MRTPSLCRRNWKLLALIAALAVVSGCAAPAIQQATAPEADRWITDVESREEASHWALTVKGNRPLDYTLQEQKDFAGLVLLFPATGLDRLQETIQPPENPAIEVIRLHELQQDGVRAVRMRIALKSPLPHEIRPEGSDLVIRFAKAAPPPEPPGSAAAPKETDLAAPAAPQAAPVVADRGTGPATSLSRVEAETAERSAVIRVQADGTLENFRSFTMSEEPPRIVFDFPGLKSPFRGEQRMTLKGGPVGRVRHFATAERLRLVVETRPEYLKKYRAEPVEDGLRILVGEDLPTVAGPAPKPAPAPALSAARADRPAWINRLEFAEEEGGRSAVIVGTTAPVDYELVPAGEREVRLRLPRARLPEKYSRPLITTRFESAVDRVTPIGAAGETVLAVQLREKVEVAAEQTGNVIRLNVAASRIPPKPHEGAEPPTWKTEAAPAVLSAAAVPPAVRPAAVGAAPPAVTPRGGSRVENLAGPEEKVYTGEKIALDFYDTDIRNVFRILQEISGKNFAIDKNVTGKVTLALQKPVPWDQVLDLVLKMNQLGMTREGDIIRIATLATLQQEEKLRQAQLKAEQEARKQEEEGEPLITEYIPVNYSNAKTDILPHVTNILTKDRGKASVDERNNQVIITDIPEKVRQAKAIVARIDRVTPQVIIEARVVEATSNFTREIGFDWGTISVNAFKIGGALKVGPTAFRADNIPSTFTANNSIGFNFSTLFGTNISIIDAKLAASELEGKSNVISSPKIITLSGRKATIKQGLEVPYQERDSSGNSTVRFKNVDLLLDVTPNISQDRRIVMNILLTKNDVIDPTAKEPALSTNEAKTEILVEDGDTIVIGGILKDTKRLADSGIPGLRKLPAVGWLFRSEKIENQKNELLIFITPRIIQLEQRKLA